MGRSNGARQGGARGAMRARIAAAAARIMAEEGIDDFALAKRKAARRLGAAGFGSAARRTTRSRWTCAPTWPSTRPRSIRNGSRAAPHRAAGDAMRSSASLPTSPDRCWPALAGPYAEIDLQLFPESTKDVELFLLDRTFRYEATDERRYAGDRARAVAVISLDWQGVPLRLAVFDPRDERSALKTTPAGRVAARAGIAEVRTLVEAAACRPAGVRR